MSTPEHSYRNYVLRLSKRFEALLSSVEGIHGFDFGDEFEIAICQILRHVVPTRYGICRGHVVDVKGNEAGDDIIIFDAGSFPTLRILGAEEFARKEWIPVEAVCAYIEAKHTLVITSDETDRKGIAFGCEQIKKVRTLCGNRQVPQIQYSRQHSGIYGVLLSRLVSSKRDGDAETLGSHIQECLPPKESRPDLVVAGDSHLVVPFVPEGDTRSILLFEQPRAEALCLHLDGVAFGFGICTLLAALDSIVLPPMPWVAILNDALDKSGRAHR